MNSMSSAPCLMIQRYAAKETSQIIAEATVLSGASRCRRPRRHAGLPRALQHPAPGASHKLPGEITRLTLVRSSLVPHLSLPASIARSWRFCAVTGLISEKNSAQLMARVQLAGFAGPLTYYVLFFIHLETRRSEGARPILSPASAPHLFSKAHPQAR